MSTPLLAVQDLNKSYGDFRAVKGVSFTVSAGEIVALIGPNGAGKTTCFNMLMGQITPTSGAIVLDGVPVQGQPPRAIWRLGVGRTFQIAAAYGSMTVLENVQVAMLSTRHQAFQFLNWRAVRDTVAAQALLAQVGLADQGDRACAELAYGDIKRLELAMALAHRPRLLLMDEPTAGMAASEREALMHTVDALAQQHAMAVLFTEHDMDAVFGHAHRVLVLDRGRLIANGTPAEVRADANVQQVYLGAGSLHT
jgi:branched-chain amino acid transport system ATP-binding protein